jgi:hypothetical protein
MFNETYRLASEREAEPQPPRKKRRRAQGTEAPDMSLVTPQNVGQRSGWKVTPTGRIVRIVKMRPTRPLADVMDMKKVKKRGLLAKGKVNGNQGKRKKVLARMRRRTIDPTRWGSVHLKGVFLDVEGFPKWKSNNDEMVCQEEGRGNSDYSEEQSPDNIFATAPPIVKPTSTSGNIITSLSNGILSSPLSDDNTDIALEKQRSIALLTSLFGSQDDGEWGGRESVGSDVDEGERHRNASDVSKDNEVIPMDVVPTKEVTVYDDNPLDDERPREQRRQQTKLKDLFAPTEESGMSNRKLCELLTDSIYRQLFHSKAPGFRR